MKFFLVKKNQSKIDKNSIYPSLQCLTCDSMLNEKIIKKIEPDHCGLAGLLDTENYDPLFEDHRPKYSVFVKFLSDRGFVYEPISRDTYLYDFKSGTYEKCNESSLKDSIYYLWRIKTDGNFNLMARDVYSIIEQFKSTSRTEDLDLLFKEYKTTHPEYEKSTFLPVDGQLLNILNKHDIFPFKNGLFNSEFEEIIPHCRYNFVSIPYDHDFDLLSKEDLFGSEIKEDYLSIFPDEDTLKYFVYWVGNLLFEKRPLPCFLNFVGRGSTGKSLISSILCEILGRKRSATVRLSDLLDRHGFSIVENKDLLICNESESTKTATYAIKELVGQNSVQINPKYKDIREIENYCRLIVCGNKYLDIDSTDSGIKRRIRIIRFRNHLDLEFGSYLYDKLSSKEGKDWLISCAYYCWKDSWFKKEEEMRSLSMINEYNTMVSFDPLNDWLLSRCGSLDKDIVGRHFHKKIRKDLFDEYCSYCYYLNDKPLKMVKWNEKMSVDFDLNPKNGSGYTYLYYESIDKE